MKPNSTSRSVSRRKLLKTGAAAAFGGGATLLGGAAPLAAVQAAQQPARRDGVAGRKYQAFVRTKTSGAALQELTLLPLDPMRVLVRTEAAQCCYSDTGRALGTNLAAAGSGAFAQATVLGHGGIGIVEAVGSMVKRVQVGDRVIVANTAQCGECYNCLRGRADHCLLNGAPLVPVAQMRDGTP